jgi:gelsolin
MTGSIKVDEIKERPLTQNMLNSKESFILELYNVVYVWQGHEASIQEKRCGVTLAHKYTKEWNKPKGTQISRIP